MVIINKIWRIIELLCEILFFAIPIKKNRVMFRSFAGQYNDNPRRISEKLYEFDQNLEIIWIISNKCHEKENIPQYVKCVKDNTVFSCFYKKTSKVLVENGLGWDMWLNHKYLYYIYKRKGQFNLSTWHGGVNMKHFGYDIKEFSSLDKRKGNTTSDLITLSNEFSREMFKHAFFGEKLKFIESGTPKNDILFNINNKKRYEYLKKLNLSPNFKYVLYAPTYRDQIEFSGINQLKEINIKEFLKKLGEKFGGQFKMIVRAHNLVLDALNSKNIIDGVYIINGNLYDDMNEYLYVSDVLLTDYSSCIGDNALTNKPCFIYISDFEIYKRERGTGGKYYFDVYDMPEPISKTYNELIFNIENYNINNVINKRKEFLNKIGNYEKGTASEEISRLILSKIYDAK